MANAENPTRPHPRPARPAEAHASENEETQFNQFRTEQHAQRPQEESRRTTAGVQETTRQAAGRAKETLSQAGQQARARASQAANRIRHEAGTYMEDRKMQTADKVSHVGAALKRAAGKLHDENDHGIAQYADAAAEETDRVAHYIRDNDHQSLMQDARCFVRRHPVATFAGLFATGVALSRFLKASDDNGASDESGSGYSGASESDRLNATREQESTLSHDGSRP